MKNYKIAICDQEVDYAFGLMNYMNSHPEEPCMAMAFTSEENLRNYLKNNKVELLLAGEGVDRSLSEEIATIWLSEHAEAVQEDTIYKYQPADQLSRSIATRFGIKEESKAVPKFQGVEVLGVYSPIGRCGKTNLARALCAVREEEGLYVGLEEYGSFQGESRSEELLYYIKVRDIGLLNRLPQFVFREKQCSFLPSPEGYLDIREINTEDIQWFLECLKEAGIYKRVVLDVGAGALPDYEILGLMDRVFVPMLEDSVSQIKREHFEHVIGKAGLEHIKQRMQVVSVPVQAYNSYEMLKFAEKIL